MEQNQTTKKKPKSRKNKERTSTFKNFLRSFWRTTVAITYSLGTAIVSFLIIFLVIGFAIYFSYAQGFKTAKFRTNSTQTVFFDKDGGVIYESYGTKAPTNLDFDEIPEVVKKATLAAEDSGFYHHAAIEPKGLARAALINVRDSSKLGFLRLTDLFDESSYTQGGSTITQQLVKNVYLTNERSFERKMKEIAYSFELEKKLSKDEILEKYLNNVYYGEQSLGIQNAAVNYFEKDAKDLTLAEASILAGITVAPSRLSPKKGDFQESKKRQEYVLSQMYSLSMITFDEAKEAANQPLYFSNRNNYSSIKHPYYVGYIKEQLKSKIGEEALENGGLKVYTALDPLKQIEAENTARDYMGKYSYRNVSNAAVVVLDNKNQELVAMVGGVDWDKSKVNVATALRQPGSSFKPVVYTAGLLSDYTAASILSDVSVNFGGNPPYRPRNYDGGYRGYVTMRTALQNSLNIPAVEMTALAGVDKVVETAQKMGISSINEPKRYGLSIGLGSAEVTLLDLTKAYSIYPRGGQLGEFVGIKKMVDNEGSTIYEQPKIQQKVLDEKISYIMTNILSDNNSRKMVFGTRSPLFLTDRKVGAKTGTTDNYADSWTVGFSNQYTVGVWMGNNDRTVMKKVSGVEGAAYIWNDIMKGIHLGLPAEDFTKPTGLEEKWIDTRRGTEAKVKRSPYILEYFMPGTAPGNKVDLTYLNRFRSYSTKNLSNVNN